MNPSCWTNGLWQEKRSLNSRFGLFADALHANPAVQSMLVVQPDRNRQELGRFTYVPNPMTGVKRKL